MDANLQIDHIKQVENKIYSLVNFNSLISVDSFVEGQHFPKDLDPFFIGYRSIAVAASDILAMGARPEGGRREGATDPHPP